MDHPRQLVGRAERQEQAEAGVLLEDRSCSGDGC